MQEIVSQFQLIISSTSGAVFVVVGLTGVAHLLAKFLLAGLLRSTRLSRTTLDDNLVGAIQKPLLYFVWLLGLSWAVDIIDEANAIPLFSFADDVTRVAVIVLLAWGLVRVISGIERVYVTTGDDVGESEERSIDASTAAAIAKLLRMAVVITAALIIMQALGYSISGVLAFGGVGGIAVGFAAQDLLSNFFGALTIHLDRPFKVGDWIRSPDKDIEGTVEYIGWRVTRIRTFDMRPLYVPNATFTKIAVENPSRMLNRRIYETVGVRYDDAAVLEVIVADVEAMLRHHAAIDTSRTLMVNFNAFGASSLDFFVYCFTHTTVWTEYHQVKQDILFKIYAIVAGHGADIAYPTTRVQWEQINPSPEGSPAQ
jgi:MscS family membrane protein